MALSERSIQPGLVHHSDRGSKYASNDDTDLLKADGMDNSMSRKGNPWIYQTNSQHWRDRSYRLCAHVAVGVERMHRLSRQCWLLVSQRPSHEP
jgi:hypothetical protein